MGKMEELKDYLIAAATAVGTLGGWQAIRYLLNLRAERRKAAAEAELKELEADEKELGVMHGLIESLQQRIEQQDRKISELNARVDRLYEEKHKLERENNELLRENSMLKVELERARHNVCVRPDDECLRRMPDRDYCRLVRLARGKYDSYHETIDNGKLTIDNEDGGGQEPVKNGKEEEDADGNEEEEHH